MNAGASLDDWRDIHAFWFPAALANPSSEVIASTIKWWSGGNATADVQRFQPTVAAAIAGRLDHWCENATGRLSLIVVLDQFTRSLFNGTPQAFASDAKALAVAEQGFQSGHYDRLSSIWEQSFFLMPLVHAEGPSHLRRLELVRNLTAKRLARTPEPLKAVCAYSLKQAEGNIDVISRFGRFPHRNAVLGRASTDEEQAYIRQGDFVHKRRFSAAD